MAYLEVCESFKVASLRCRLSIPMPPSIHPFKLNCIDVKIYRKIRELPWITIFGSRVRRFAGDFHEWRIDEWKSSANPITCDPKIVIHGNGCIILFPTCYLMSWAHSTAKNDYRSLILPLSQRNVFSDSDLWRTQSCHANVGYWYRDVIFVDCFCTRKLAHKRFSHVNNNREYRFLTTQYSRLSV